jgi:predicted Rossmann-fold nucleotide-binding protein
MPESLRIIAVVGMTKSQEVILKPDEATLMASARAIGREISGKAILLTGGDGKSPSSVKNEAIIGAGDDAKIISILQNDPQNGGVDDAKNGRIVVSTGLKNGRNVVNALAADAMIVLEGGEGTLSEAAFAQMTGRCVILFGGAETKFEKAFSEGNRWREIAEQSAVMQSVLPVACTEEALKHYAREALAHGLKISDVYNAIKHAMTAPLRGELPPIKRVDKGKYEAALSRLGR